MTPVWETKAVGDVCLIVGGGTPSRSNAAFYDGKIPWATIRDMKSDWIESTEFSITPNAVKSSATNVLPAGTVIAASRVGLGKVCRLRRDTAINQDLRGFIPKSAKQLDPQYLFLWFKSVSDQIIAAGTGATVQGVTLPFLRSLQILLPPLEEQWRIVALLDETFAAIATATANAKKNLVNARELYEGQINSARGEVTSLENLITVKTGKLDANAAVEGGAYPFFTCSKDTYAIDNYAFDCEAILLAGNNAVGDFNVKHYCGKFNAYQRTYVIKINNENLLSYEYLYLSMKAYLSRFKEQSVGSGTKFLKMSMVKGMTIYLPTLSEQERIVSMLNALGSEIRRLEALNCQKITALSDLKELLLHLAFTGKLTAIAPETIAA